MQDQKTIIWDWNGTLLDDINICIETINCLLGERSKKPIDKQIYREIFTFPVKDYYIKAGFDFEKEPFEKPALEFIETYEQRIVEANLFSDVNETLARLHNDGHSQMILSAMQHDFLISLVESHSIAHFFTKISGIDNHYAAGKIESGKSLLNSLNGHPKEVILIGDTIHDHEVGQELGIEVILVSRGHQSEERLRTTGRRIARSLGEIPQMI